ncbi:bifunctional diguanylate cyclase/phosphodiesterase [Henriciella sp.]|uniref:putative bifunctional diguanylate cyclase/phosphodiesterase n=1 Tax=Henriciella sp. TaxID=1968823 RepID=UPI002603267B|nr:GGDEF domain-containing phosphodiesterase [Henriciella sp.]
MKHLIGQISTGHVRSEAWWSCAGLMLGFGPFALLLVLVPQKVHLSAFYALGVIGGLLAMRLGSARKWFLEGNNPQASKKQSYTENAVKQEGTQSVVQGRENLVSVLSRELTPSLAPSLLGIIRIANYDRMVAFDVAVADRFLNAFHERARNALGKSRLLTRVESNCFAIWFGGTDELEAARAELQALAYALREPIFQEGVAIEPELEIGSAETRQQLETPGELISRGLASLSRPGTRGGTPAPASEDSVYDLRRRFALEQDLREAISKGELALHYQPLIDTARMRVSGAEALLRWSHPRLGAISPVEFVPILEDSGLMEEVGIWVINTACRQLREWRMSGHPDFKMAINLSARQLRNPELKTVIKRTVQNHGLTPASIEFELTETAAMENSALTLQIFSSLREAGFGLAIDDFGSGYSSLSYLKNLPVSKLKIDREFVSHVDQSSTSGAICKALIELASGLGISALAEGVERREELDALALMGCTSFQGFYFAKPMDAVAFSSIAADPVWLQTICSPVADMHDELERRYL